MTPKKTKTRDTREKAMADLLTHNAKKRDEAERTLDRLAAVLSRNEWNSDTLEDVAYILRESGREVLDPEDQDPPPNPV